MPPEDMAPEDAEESAETPEEEDQEVKAFRVLRHAIADGDDAAGAEALGHFIEICEAKGDYGDGEKEKPNLAMILMGKKKKD